MSILQDKVIAFWLELKEVQESLVAKQMGFKKCDGCANILNI